MRLRAIRLVPCLLAFTCGALLTAQDAAPPISPQKPPVVVAGGNTRVLPPERVAIGMYFSSMAASASQAQTSGMNEARIKGLGLSRADEKLFRTELTALFGRLRSKSGEIEEAAMRARTERTPEAARAYTSTVESRDNVAWESYQHMLERLSPKGAKRLAAKMAEVRSQIRPIGPPR